MSPLYVLLKVSKGSPVHSASIDEDFAVVAFAPEGGDGETELMFLLSLKFCGVVCQASLEGSVSGLAALAGGTVVASLGGAVVQFRATELPRSLDGAIGGLLPAGGGERRSRRKSGGRSSDMAVRMPDAVSSSVTLYTRMPGMFKNRDVAGLEKVLRGGEEVPELLLLAAIEFLLKCPEQVKRFRS